MSDWFGRFGFAEVGDGLLVGAYPLDAEDVAQIASAGVDIVDNLVEDAEYDAGERDVVATALEAAGVSERRLPLVDYDSVPEPALDRAVDEILGDLEAGHRVYLHCRAGWQRSATVAAGVLALREDLEIEDALAVLRERKPTAEPLGHQRSDLLAWWRAREH
jgi:ADP-ribosyl-[dinitrogen reductase] hydrolase